MSGKAISSNHCGDSGALLLLPHVLG